MTRLVGFIVTGLFVMVGMLAVGAGSASAGVTRGFEGSFGPDGTSATRFERPAAVAVDQSAGDVYV